MSEKPEPTPAGTPTIPAPSRPSFLRRVFRWQVIRVVLFGGVCLVTLILLANAVLNWRAQRAWTEYRRQLEAQGEKLRWADHLPAPVPPDQDFFKTPLMADALSQRPPTNPIPLHLSGSGAHAPSAGGWRLGRFTVLADWHEYLRGNTEHQETPRNAAIEAGVRVSAPAAGAAILEWFRRYDAQWAELRVASRRPYARFPINWNRDLMEVDLPQVTVVKDMVQTCSLRACAALAAGQPDEALADVRLNWRLMDALQEMPLLISFLVRIAVNEITSQPVWEGLAAHRWTEPQLVALDKELAGLNFLADEITVLRGERAGVNATLDSWVRSRADLARSAQQFDGGNKSARGVALILSPRWILRNNQRLINEFYQDVISNLQRAIQDPSAHPLLDRSPEQEWERRLARKSVNNFLAGLLLPATARCTAKACNAQTTVNFMRVGVALERHRLATGAYPESLESLVPRFLDKVPLDVFDAQPLRYRLQSDGAFLLYSVGANGVDDGGQVALNQRGGLNLGEGDWVWRYPAPK